MIAREQITSIVKTYLPQVQEYVADRIAGEIVTEAEAITYSLIRQKVADQRKRSYISSLKNWEAINYVSR